MKNETHWACANRLRREGDQASCCKCNPHYDFDCGDDNEINKYKRAEDVIGVEISGTQSINPDKVKEQKEHIYNNYDLNDYNKVRRAAEESVILMEIENILCDFGILCKKRILHNNEILEYANKIFNLIKK